MEDPTWSLALALWFFSLVCSLFFVPSPFQHSSFFSNPQQPPAFLRLPSSTPSPPVLYLVFLKTPLAFVSTNCMLPIYSALSSHHHPANISSSRSPIPTNTGLFSFSRVAGFSSSGILGPSGRHHTPLRNHTLRSTVSIPVRLCVLQVYTSLLRPSHWL